jgi:hypothetical protein
LEEYDELFTKAFCVRVMDKYLDLFSKKLVLITHLFSFFGDGRKNKEKGSNSIRKQALVFLEN